MILKDLTPFGLRGWMPIRRIAGCAGAFGTLALSNSLIHRHVVLGQRGGRSSDRPVEGKGSYVIRKFEE